MSNLQNKLDWEDRAQANRDAPKGVLMIGLPEYLNESISRWQSQILRKFVIPELKSNAFVLDLACAYGRLSKVLKESKSDINLFGLDFSLKYCNLYKDKGSSICADMTLLPLKNSSFEVIVLATGLMYLERNKLDKSLISIIDKLKPGGVAFFCEPGLELMSLIERVRLKPSISNTGGKGFYKEEFLNLFNEKGLEILYIGSNACFSIVLPICIALKKFPLLSKWIAHAAIAVDLRIKFWDRFALHRCLIVRKN